MSRTKTLAVIGGPAGGGKTSVGEQLLRSRRFKVVANGPIVVVDADKVTPISLVRNKMAEHGAEIDSPSYAPVSQWINERRFEAVSDAFESGANTVLLTSPSVMLGYKKPDTDRLQIEFMLDRLSVDRNDLRVIVVYLLMTGDEEQVRQKILSRIAARLRVEPERGIFDQPKLDTNAAYYFEQGEQVRSSLTGLHSANFPCALYEFKTNSGIHVVASGVKDLLFKLGVGLGCYTPIDYGDLDSWGSGDRVKSLLAMLAARKYRDALRRQDKRGDTGHWEMVTLIGSKLARMLGLDEGDRQVVELALIYHDTGFSKIDNVNERFRAAAEEFRASGLKSEREHPGLWALRVEHQQHSVRIANDELGMYPRLGEVTEIVGDHDTRLNSPSLAAQIVQDADMLWRVTLLYLLRWRRAEEVLADGFVKDRLSKLKLHLPISRQIAQLELERAVQLYREMERSKGEN